MLSANPRLGSGVSLTLVNLDSWVSSIGAGTAVQMQNPASVKVRFIRPTDSIALIAEKLSENAIGIERDLLSKSLQETLLYCTGKDLELDYAEIKMRLLRFLSTRGKSALIEQFLCLCIFNLVWMQIGDFFRTNARTVQSFEREIEGVELICKRIVASVWSSYDSRDGELAPRAAEELIRTIENQLRVDSNGLKSHKM